MNTIHVAVRRCRLRALLTYGEIRRAASSPPPGLARVSRSKRQRGIAILVVLITIALLTAIIVEFQYSATVDLRLAYNARDELQAEYNALTALRLRSLLLRQGMALQAGMAGMLQALTGSSSTQLPLGQILQQIPITCGLLNKVLKETSEGDELTVDKQSRADKKARTDFLPGECQATSQSEHSKISVNMLASATNGSSQTIQTMLLAFLSDPRLQDQFNGSDSSGKYAENPAQLVAAIADWVDQDHVETGSSGDEDRRYGYLKDPYRAKNAPFDSLAEIQLVHGVNDKLFGILKDNITIYTDSTAIEISTASPERIMFGLLASRKQMVPPEQLVNGVGILMRSIADMRAASPIPGMATLTVNNLVAMVQSAGLDALIDVNAIKQTFTDRAGTTWYSIVAEGKVGNATRTMKAVLQSIEGQYYYFRME